MPKKRYKLVGLIAHANCELCEKQGTDLNPLNAIMDKNTSNIIARCKPCSPRNMEVEKDDRHF